MRLLLFSLLLVAFSCTRADETSVSVLLAACPNEPKFENEVIRVNELLQHNKIQSMYRGFATTVWSVPAADIPRARQLLADAIKVEGLHVKLLPDDPVQDIARASAKLVIHADAVFVLGEVRAPQWMPRTSGLTLSGALGNSGGYFSPIRIYLIRDNAVILKTDSTQIGRNGAMNDPLLESKDIVYVGSIGNL
ncbi:MAG: hypothetical protein P4L99_27650 [Chthoniobacter sp.]|nr:hypothetical protein [Chthoniobacter sp.]